jgi:tetratricopeptide (TPR) repeat protein
MKAVFITFLSCLLPWSGATAGDYKVFPPKDPVECQASEFHVYCAEGIALRQPPAHPDFLWLNTNVEDEEAKDAKGEVHSIKHGVIRFVPLRAGTLEVPPLPATVDGSQVLLRYEPITVSANRLPPNATRMATLWNGAVEPPAFAMAGESFDLEILLFAAQGSNAKAEFEEPELLLPNARWQRNSLNIPGFAQKEGSLFYYFGTESYSETTTSENGIEFGVRRYKARFSVGESGTLQGVLAARAGVSDLWRTVYQRVSIPIRPLPPVPRGEFINTALVGQWSFKATLDPEKPVAGQAFTVRLDIDGTGDRYQCTDFDFSGLGFKSLGKSLKDRADSRVDHWRGCFEQRLLPTGQAASFPALVLGSFDPAQGKWIKHSLLAEKSIAGVTAQLTRPNLTTTPGLGERVRRPVWRNFPPTLLPLAALATLLPLGASWLRRRLDSRDPRRAVLRRQRALLVRELGNADPTKAAALLEQEGLSLLRAHLGMPDAAVPGEIANALSRDAAGSELAQVLRENDARRFSGGSAVLDGPKLARLFARLALLFILSGMAPLLQAMTPEECDAASRNGEWERAASGYDELIQQDPERPALYLNLAKVLTSAGRLQEARAACHTALLLEPRDGEARALHASLLLQLNQPPEFSVGFWRPDQLLAIAAILWIAAWVLFGLQRLNWLPLRWPAFAVLALAICFAGAAAFRSSAYASGQYLVIAKDEPSLPQGAIVRGSPGSDTAWITSSYADGSPRLIMAKHLRAIW